MHSTDSSSESKPPVAAQSHTNGMKPRGSQQRFPVVGIGASAGGLQAFSQFFRHLPRNTGMAFVLIQHLAPDHEIHLAELLQQHTEMPVMPVQQEVPVRPNHVYVIPPAKALTICEGRLRVADASTENGSRLCMAEGRRGVIDHFFCSLAQDQDENAICVILSGTGADGTLGLKAIKEAGGIALVQSTEEAEYDGMPSSAIFTGLADVVGSTAELASKLVSYRNAVAVHQSDDIQALTRANIQALKQISLLIGEKTGHDFSQYRDATILRRIERRLRFHHCETIADYSRYLRAHPEEVQILFKDLLISVTKFFRDPEAFAVLEKQIVPSLFEGKQSYDCIRVWVPGCATGEEAYSIAMLLYAQATQRKHAPEIQIFATDIDDRAIALAREGQYPLSIATDVLPERLQRFFVQEADGYKVSRAIRDLVLFTTHSLLMDPPFPRLDLISCRNLLVYLTRAGQQRVLELFHYALRPDGYLFLGSAETTDIASELFANEDPKQHIFRRRQTASGMHLPGVSLGRERSLGANPENDQEKEIHASLEYRYRNWQLQHHTPPSILIDEQLNILHIFGGAGQYLQEEDGPFTSSILKKIVPALRLDLRTAIQRAFRDGEHSTSRLLRVPMKDGEQMVRVHVGPLNDPAFTARYIEVVFEKVDIALLEEIRPVVDPEEGARSLVTHLEAELQRTQRRLQSTAEEYDTSAEDLRAPNEELYSMNEELRSTTEELEASQEELQAVNQELRDKIGELRRANSNLQNLIESTNVGTLFLDRSLRLKFFTPQAAHLFHLNQSDLGQLLAHVSHQLDYDDLLTDAEQVLNRLTRVERELKDKDGRWYMAHLFPYRTLEDKFDGVVMTFVDITELKQAEQAVAQRALQQSKVAALGQMALAGMDLERLMQEAARSAANTLGVELCKVLELLPDGKHLLLVAGIGWQEGLIGEEMVGAGVDSQAGYTLQRGEAVVVEDLAQEERFGGSPLFIEHGVVSGLSVVIEGAERAYGVLSVHTTQKRHFTGDDVHFVQSIANVLAQAIERKQAEDALAQTNQMLEARVAERTQALTESNAQLQAEVDARQRAQERFQKAFQVNPAASVIASLSDLRYLDVNTSFLALTGYAEKEIVGHTDQEIGLLLDVDKRGVIFTALRSGESVIPYEGRIRTRSGEIRHVITASEPIEVDGEPCLLGMMIDITEQKEREESLCSYQEHLQEMVEARTAELEERTQALAQEVTVRKQAETQLLALNETLEERVADRTTQVRALASALTLAEQRERQRIAGILHDHLQQVLYALLFRTKLLLESDSRKQADLLPQLRNLVEEAINTTRTLTVDLSPPILAGEGLGEAINWLAEQMREVHHLAVTVDVQEVPPELPEEMRVLLFQLVRELLFNVVKHAGVDEAKVILAQEDGYLIITVIDEGTGFDTRYAFGKQDSETGWGLFSIRERLGLFGGQLHIKSTPGRGTHVALLFPLELNNREVENSR